MRTQTRRLVLLAAGCLALWGTLAGPAGAQGASAEDASALAKTIQNPLAALVTVPFQANYNDGVGPYDRTFFNLNVQPVVPFPGKKWNVIVRTIIPVNSAPVDSVGSIFGIGDATMAIYFSPAKGSSFTWGLGPIVGLPTASNPEALGSGKFGVGPSAIVFYQVGKFTMGFVGGNIWSFAGESDRSHYNTLTLQYFLNFNFGGGWALGTAPILSANWKAGEKWTIPWGAQISKVTHIGTRPVNVLVGYYYNSEHPTGSADSQVRLQLNLLYPTRSR